MRWLSRLLDLILPPRTGECLVRRADAESVGRLVQPTRIPSQPFEIAALLPYPNPLVAALIKELKFHRNPKALTLLSGVLADYLAEHLADDRALEARSYTLVPIPLSRSRRGRRGYNQTELLCREAAKQLPGVPVDPDLLTRIRDTLPQTQLSGRRRLENMRGAFGAGPANPEHTYILVDDVTTTGATLQAAVRALMQAGTTRIMPIALAH